MLYLAMAIAMSVGRSASQLHIENGKLNGKRPKQNGESQKCAFMEYHTPKIRVSSVLHCHVSHKYKYWYSLTSADSFEKSPRNEKTFFIDFTWNERTPVLFFLHCALLSKHSKPKKRIWIWFFFDIPLVFSLHLLETAISNGESLAHKHQLNEMKLEQKKNMQHKKHFVIMAGTLFYICCFFCSFLIWTFFLLGMHLIIECIWNMNIRSKPVLNGNKKYHNCIFHSQMQKIASTAVQHRVCVCA